MKTKNALTVRPDPGLPELKRAGNLIRITERILATPTVPARNRTDEHGRKLGRWTEFVDGDVYEGTYVDDKENGPWVLRFADGSVGEGEYVGGKRHGHWVIQSANGKAEGTFVNDRMHGPWVKQHADGTVVKKRFENGRKID